MAVRIAEAQADDGDDPIDAPRGKKEPFYHVVVTDSRRSGGGALEQVGFFNPVARGASEELRLDLARVDHWVARVRSPPSASSSC